MSALIAPDEVLFRQIHPDFIDNGTPSSDRFRPSARDQGKLSVDRGGSTTAEESFSRYTEAGNKSAAVFGVSVGEFEEESVSCVADPISAADDGPANPHHALADFSSLDSRTQKAASKRLRQKAVNRGQLHPSASHPESEQNASACNNLQGLEDPIASSEGAA